MNLLSADEQPKSPCDGEFPQLDVNNVPTIGGTLQITLFTVLEE